MMVYMLYPQIFQRLPMSVKGNQEDEDSSEYLGKTACKSGGQKQRS